MKFSLQGTSSYPPLHPPLHPPLQPPLHSSPSPISLPNTSQPNGHPVIDCMFLSCILWQEILLAYPHPMKNLSETDNKHKEETGNKHKEELITNKTRIRQIIARSKSKYWSHRRPEEWFGEQMNKSSSKNTRGVERASKWKFKFSARTSWNHLTNRPVTQA